MTASFICILNKYALEHFFILSTDLLILNICHRSRLAKLEQILSPDYFWQFFPKSFTCPVAHVQREGFGISGWLETAIYSFS